MGHQLTQGKRITTAPKAPARAASMPLVVPSPARQRQRRQRQQQRRRQYTDAGAWPFTRLPASSSSSSKQSALRLLCHCHLVLHRTCHSLTIPLHYPPRPRRRSHSLPRKGTRNPSHRKNSALSRSLSPLLYSTTLIRPSLSVSVFPLSKPCVAQT